jgi:hypothetical protein
MLPFGLVILAVLTLQATPARAQQTVISDAYLIWNPQKDQHNAVVKLTANLSKKPDPSQVTLLAKPSGTKLAVTSVDFVGSLKNKLAVDWSPGVVAPSADDTDIELIFARLEFTSEIQTQVVGSGPIYSSTTISKLLDKTRKAVNDAASHSKTAEEKNLFAGLNVAVPTTGASEGNAEIHINRWVAPDFFVSANLRKSSATNADPKQFDLGLTYRKVLNRMTAQARSISDRMAKVGQSSDPNEESQKILGDLKALQDKALLLGIIIDGAARIEGEAMNFNVTNAVFDLPIQLVSRTKNALAKDGYWNFRVMPAGVELGRNLRTENERMQKYYVGRFKYGGVLTFVYNPMDQQNAFPKRIELDIQAIDRYLFRNEVAFDEANSMATAISRGNKPWYQADLKVFFVNSEQGRFGFRVNFIRGKLPPAFADTKGFTFGVIFETADEDSSK